MPDLDQLMEGLHLDQQTGGCGRVLQMVFQHTTYYVILDMAKKNIAINRNIPPEKLPEIQNIHVYQMVFVMHL